MELWDVPDDINAVIKVLPNRMYVNKVIKAPLEKVFRELISTGLYRELRTYDGCFVVRKQRGSNAISTHSWGLAVDFNAAWNPLVRGVTPATRKKLRAEKVTFSEEFLDVWRKHGWNCGADWISVLDGQHFQWDKF
jgi:hypothetical protein